MAAKRTYPPRSTNPIRARKHAGATNSIHHIHPTNHSNKYFLEKGLGHHRAPSLTLFRERQAARLGPDADGGLSPPV